MTFERDALGENPAWQDVYRWLHPLLEPLRLCAWRHPLAPEGSNWLLDAHMAQAQMVLHLIESQLEWLDHQDIAGFDLASAIGELLIPRLSIDRMRQMHGINLRAYAELLRVYLELLKEIRNDTDGHQSSASKLEKYHLG
jgi:hypothetical protein